MRILSSIVAVALMAAPALAQQPANYTITLTNDQLNFIGKALGKLPYEDSYQVIEVIKLQVQLQQQKAAEDAKKPPEEKKP